MKKSLFVLSLLLSIALLKTSFCQEFVFKDGDRVCFIGSSIAMNGANFHYINLFYATRYPDRKVTFLNAGISGDVTDEILERLQTDILDYHPTHAVLMLEENDLNPSLYYKARQNEPGIMEKRQKALENWFNNADTIIRKLKEAHINVILETPTIYDQTGNLPAENAFGINDALRKCVVHLKGLAANYKLPLVDCWTILYNDNEKIQRKDITKSIIGNDRMHVSKLGYLVMAYQFLKTQQVNKIVSTVTIDAKGNKVKQQSNCTIGNLKGNSKNLTFTYLCKSLPFPSPEGVNVDSLHPFTDDLNAEIMQVKGLARGNYKIIIDTTVTGIYSNKELEKGINLSQNKNSPQYQQATQVLRLFNDYWAKERTLRVIKYVEYQHRLNRLKNKDDMAEVKKFFDETLEKNKSSDNYGFFKNVFTTYLTNKPQEKEMGIKSESLYNQIYQVNKPVEHIYKIERLD